MLAKTEDTRAVLDVFFRTHDAEVVGLGGVMWRQQHLPDAGALGDQDAKGMAELAWARQVANALVARRKRPGDADAESAAFHDRYRKGKHDARGEEGRQDE